jgi:hypothetical protein
MQLGFDLGQIVVTPRASALLAEWGQTAEDLIERHQSCDWGDVTEEERHINEFATTRAMNVVSCYTMPGGDQLTVFTRADRAYTLVHLRVDTRSLDSRSSSHHGQTSS